MRGIHRAFPIVAALGLPWLTGCGGSGGSSSDAIEVSPVPSTVEHASAGPVPADVGEDDGSDGSLPCPGTTQVTVGGSHTCARLSTCEVKCWGHDRYGELGDGVMTPSSPTPVAVTGLTGATAIAAGNSHTCALRTDGTVRCWGYDDDGELGDGTTTSSSAPVAVKGLHGATGIAAGAFHTCALISDGTVRCWGSNRFGGLGNGTTTSSNKPVVVKHVHGATAVTAGEYHTCALIADGTVQCWGFNSLYGELGDGTSNDSSTPVAVTGLGGVTAIATGAYHTCALLQDATARCWGWGAEHGQLGTGAMADSNTPLAVAGLSGATSIAAGYAHTCAVLSSGAVKCWGDNAWGDLGDGTATPSDTPVTVSGL